MKSNLVKNLVLCSLIIVSISVVSFVVFAEESSNLNDPNLSQIDGGSTVAAYGFSECDNCTIKNASTAGIKSYTAATPKSNSASDTSKVKDGSK